MIEYDAHDFRKPKRTKRISAFTGKPTNLLPETELQIACVTYYNKRRLIDAQLRHHTRLFAVGAAEGNIPLASRVLMKRMGKIRGPFDAQLIDLRNGFQYTWIEFKWGDNGYTPEQAAFAEWLSDTPIRCLAVYSLDEFIGVIS